MTIEFPWTVAAAGDDDGTPYHCRRCPARTRTMKGIHQHINVCHGIMVVGLVFPAAEEADYAKGDLPEQRRTTFKYF